jgi:hypothetical protein
MTGHPVARRSLLAVLPVPLLVLAACTDAPTPVAPAAVTVVAAQHALSQPLRLAFEKCPAGAGVWEGEVTGDVTGTLRTELTDLQETGAIWHVRFDWIIDADDPQRSFVADLTGILNTNTGGVVMNGTVREGYLRGAQVHEDGQPGDGPGCFTGTIRIMPATAR